MRNKKDVVEREKIDKDVEMIMWWTICKKRPGREFIWYRKLVISLLLRFPSFLRRALCASIESRRISNTWPGMHMVNAKPCSLSLCRPFVKVTFNYRKLAEHSLVPILFDVASFSLSLMCVKTTKKERNTTKTIPNLTWIGDGIFWWSHGLCDSRLLENVWDGDKLIASSERKLTISRTWHSNL